MRVVFTLIQNIPNIIHKEMGRGALILHCLFLNHYDPFSYPYIISNNSALTRILTHIFQNLLFRLALRFRYCWKLGRGWACLLNSIARRCDS